MKRLFAIVITSLLAAGITAAQEDNTTLSGTAYQTTNLRSNPDTQSEIVGRVAAGDVVRVDGRDAEEARWLRVIAPEEVSGWVAVFAVVVEGDLETLPIITGDEAADGGDVRFTAYGRVNVRNGPGLDYTIISQLDVGQTLIASARSGLDNDWLYFEAETGSGWVAYFTVSVVGNANNLPILVVDGSGNMFVPPEEVVTANFNISLRAEPNSEAEILATVLFESNVTPLALSDDGLWIFVLYGDTLGWGLAELFDITPEQLGNLPIFGAQIDITPEAEAPADAESSTPPPTDIPPTSTPEPEATTQVEPPDEG